MGNTEASTSQSNSYSSNNQNALYKSSSADLA